MKLSRQQLSLHWSLCAACWKMASNTAESSRIPEAPMMSLHKSLHLHKRDHKGSAVIDKGRNCRQYDQRLDSPNSSNVCSGHARSAYFTAHMLLQAWPLGHVKVGPHAQSHCACDLKTLSFLLLGRTNCTRFEQSLKLNECRSACQQHCITEGASRVLLDGCQRLTFLLYMCMLQNICKWREGSIQVLT